MSFFKTNDWDLFQPIGEQKEPPERILWQFMIDYQAEHQMPPTLDEMTGCLDSEYRSSAKHYVEKLVREGWAAEVADEGKSRRFRAVNAPTLKMNDPTDEIYTQHLPRVTL